MPPSKPKPSEIAAEAKRVYIPYIRENFHLQWPATSYLCYSDSLVAQPPVSPLPIRFGMHPTSRLLYDLLTLAKAFYDRDPVDVALDWAPGEATAIPVIMPANDKRPGGDWEAGQCPSYAFCFANTAQELCRPRNASVGGATYMEPLLPQQRVIRRPPITQSLQELASFQKKLVSLQ